MVDEPISREAVHAAAVLAKSMERALNTVDLTPSQHRLLVFLSEKPEAATALARRLSVTRPSLTALVDGLVARGLVVREPDPMDRRRVTHQISTEGLAMVLTADTAIQQRLGAWLENELDDEEIKVVNRGLELWGQAFVAARVKRVNA